MRYRREVWRARRISKAQDELDAAGESVRQLRADRAAAVRRQQDALSAFAIKARQLAELYQQRIATYLNAMARASTDECIRATLHGAVVRGYDATLVSDAHTTEDNSAWGAPPPDQVIAHTNLYWTSHRAPGRTARTVATKEVDFQPPA